VLRETAANWRDAWKRLGHNPLILLLLIAVIGAVSEGMARLLDLLEEYLFDLELGYLGGSLAVQALSAGGTLIVYLFFTAVALEVVRSEGSFFGAARILAPLRFWRRALLAWFIILIVPNLISFPLSIFSTMIVAAVPSWAWRLALLLGGAGSFALLQAFLASFMLWRLPVYGLVIDLEPLTDRRRPPGMFLTYAPLFVVMTVTGSAILLLGQFGFVPLASFRITTIVDAVTSLFAVLLAFVAVQRAAAVDRPAVIAVFE
jgi:hypothetical protein